MISKQRYKRHKQCIECQRHSRPYKGSYADQQYTTCDCCGGHIKALDTLKQKQYEFIDYAALHLTNEVYASWL